MPTSRHKFGVFDLISSVLFEQPWLIGAIGAILTAMTFYGWVQTGNSIALKTGIGFIGLTILLVLINVFCVTDSETIRVWLTDAASELQSNQFEKIRKRISPDHSERVANANERMHLVKFFVAKVTKIHSIEVVYKRAKATAFIRMNAFVEAKSQGISAKVPRWVGLTLEKKGEEWLITDFEDREAQHEFMNLNTFSESFDPNSQANR